MDRPKHHAARRLLALAAAAFVGCQKQSPPDLRFATPNEPQRCWVDIAARPVDDRPTQNVVPTYFPSAAPTTAFSAQANPAPYAGAGSYGYSPPPQSAPTQLQPGQSPPNNSNGLARAAPPSYAPTAAPANVYYGPPAASGYAPPGYRPSGAVGYAPQYVVQSSPAYVTAAPQYATPQYLVPQYSVAVPTYNAPAPQYVTVAPQYPGQAPRQYIVVAPGFAPAAMAPSLVTPLPPLTPGPRAGSFGAQSQPNFGGPSASVSNVASAPSNAGDLTMVNRQADERVREGFRLAERGAMHSARAEFIQSLRLVAQALDAQQSTNVHSEALSAGLMALRESRDFSPERASLEDGVDIRHIVQGHRTPVLKAAAPAGINSLTAQQRYLTFGQEQLAIAAGGQPSASLALYGVGRIAALAAAAPGNGRLGDIGVAAASYQAALAADEHNFRASNELGVILGNWGRLEAARDVFRRSLSASPQSVTWRNLSVVYHRLGQPQLAEQALTQAGPPTPMSTLPVNIAWVDPTSFSKTGPNDGSMAPPTANVAPTSPASDGRSANTAQLPNGKQTR